MSILIKDMEMPDGCFLCILSFMYFNGTENVLRCNVLKKLVSDDGSKDATLDIIKSYKDPRIKIFNHEKKISLDVRPTMDGLRRIAGTSPYSDGCGDGTR